MTDLWTSASTDVEAETLDRHLTSARIASAAVWPFLAAATSEVEYANRKALAADRIDKVAAAVAEGDPALFSVVRASLEDAFDQDFTVLHADRVAAARIEATKTAERKAAEASIKAQAEREVLQKVLAAGLDNLGDAKAPKFGEDGEPVEDDEDKTAAFHPLQKAKEFLADETPHQPHLPGQDPEEAAGRKRYQPHYPGQYAASKTAGGFGNRDMGHCDTCGRGVSYDSASRKWSHDNEGSDTAHPVKRVAIKTAADADGTEYGAWGDHCPHCGNDWKQAHEPGCLRVTNPDRARELDDAAQKHHQGSRRTASTYCPNHGVYVGEGNSEQHNECSTEQRKSKDSSLQATAGDSVEVSSIPNCDVCKYDENKATPAVYDARLPGKGGSWGNVCQRHFDLHGPGQTGTGHAQKLVQKAARRKIAVSLTHVGIEGDNGVGTDPSGNRVKFTLSAEDKKALQGVLYSDLAVNFSGVTVDESDIIKDASKTATTCSCARHDDGSVTTMLCPQHAPEDPCATMAAVTGQRRRGSIRNGTCTSCGWSKGTTASKTAATEGPFKVQITGVGEDVWSENSLRFATEDEAKAYASDLMGRWMGADMARVVPSDTPNRAPVDPSDPAIVVNYRTAGLRTQAAFPPGGGNPFGEKKAPTDKDAGAPDQTKPDAGNTDTWKCPACGSANAYTQGGVDLDEALKASQPIQCGDCKTVDSSGGSAGTQDANGAPKQDQPSPGFPAQGSRHPFGNRTATSGGGATYTYVVSSHPMVQASSTFTTTAAPFQPGIPDDMTDGPHLQQMTMDVAPQSTRPRVMPEGAEPFATTVDMPEAPAAPAEPKAAKRGFASQAFKRVAVRPVSEMPETYWEVRDDDEVIFRGDRAGADRYNAAQGDWRGHGPTVKADGTKGPGVHTVGPLQRDLTPQEQSQRDMDRSSSKHRENS